MKGFVEGVAYFKRNKEDSMRILMKKMRIEKGKETYLERSYNLFATQYMEAAPYPSVVGTELYSNSWPRISPKPKPPIPTRSSTTA